MKPRRTARKIWLVTLATCGLAGGVYAAEQAVSSEGGDLQQTINAQRIGEGRPATAGAVSEHQLQPFTPEQMILLTAQYRQEMKDAADRVEGLRIQAYKSRDLIRMTCVDDKLTQVGVIVKMAEPRAQALGRQTEALAMRAHFSLVRQARDRANEIIAEAERCMGEDFSTVSSGKIKEEEAQDLGINDPTRPASSIHTVVDDRPAEASPYR